MSTPASEHSLSSLSQNSQDTMAVLEETFPAMMELRARLTEIGADTIDKAESILAFFSKTEDLFIGSHFILITPAGTFIFIFVRMKNSIY